MLSEAVIQLNSQGNSYLDNVKGGEPCELAVIYKKISPQKKRLAFASWEVCVRLMNAVYLTGDLILEITKDVLACRTQVTNI